MNNPSNQNGIQPGGLPLYVSGWGAGNVSFTDDDSFWDEAGKVTAEGLLADHVDAAMMGQSSPRVWLFLHEPGESRLGAAAALAIARQLAHRDQAVLLLDGDDDNAELTQWAGRKDADGWIDLVRYGASVLTSGVPMPFDGRRGYLLGVGSFVPAEATEPEIKDLLNRLKRQADDVLVVAPANAVGRLWAAEAEIRLLCWDRAQRSASLVEDLLENFSTANMPMTGLIGFGLPQDLQAIDDQSVREEVGSIPVGVVDAAFVEEASGRASAVLTEQVDDSAEVNFEEEEFARRKGNSGVFWMVAVVAVLLIGSASIYWMKFIHVPTTSQLSDIPLQDVAAGGAALIDSNEVVLQGDLQDGAVAGDDEPLSAPISEADSVALALSLQPDELPVDLPVEEVALVPEAIPASDDASLEEVFTMAPYLTPVGVDGWTLHVYSFPDSLQAEREREVLATKGFQSSTRVVQFRDKGRWFRLYLGSFKTKAEANVARLKLMEELGEDWANPVRF